MREVVTLQIGHLANYVGAHFWNLQDETAGLQAIANEPAASDHAGAEHNFACDVDLDVLFRVGEARHGAPTYNPRALVIDAKGALGAIHFGAPGRDASTATVSTWAAPPRVFASDPIPPSPFQSALFEEGPMTFAGGMPPPPGARDLGHGRDVDAYAARLEEAAAALDGGVRFWSDYVKAWYYPQSVMELAGVWHGVTPFGDFGDGQEVRKCAATRDEVSDRLRVFVEECDRIQGFHILADDTSGFGALSASLLEDIADEYKSTPTLLFGCGASPGVDAGGQDDRQNYGDSASSGSAGSYAGAQGRGSSAMARGQAVVARQLSRALALAELGPLVSLYVPLYDVAATGGPGSSAPWGDFRDLRINPASPFHLGSLYGVLVDTVTLPTRLRVYRGVTSQGPLGACDSSTLVQSLTGWGPPRANIAAAALSFPCAAIRDISTLSGHSLDPLSGGSSSHAPPPSSISSSSSALLAAHDAHSAHSSGARSLLQGLVDLSAARSDGIGPDLPLGGRDTHESKGAGRRRGLRARKHKGVVFAENFVLRGALRDRIPGPQEAMEGTRATSGPVSPSSALEALARIRALGPVGTSGRRGSAARPAVISYAATCHAVPIPLPFPCIFRAHVGHYGELVASGRFAAGRGVVGSTAGVSAGLPVSMSQGIGRLNLPTPTVSAAASASPTGTNQGVVSAPALSRLSSGSHLRPWLQGVAEGFSQLCRPAGPGKVILADLGYEDGYAGALVEHLHDLQLAFWGKAEDDFLDSSSDDDN